MRFLCPHEENVVLSQGTTPPEENENLKKVKGRARSEKGCDEKGRWGCTPLPGHCFLLPANTTSFWAQVVPGRYQEQLQGEEERKSGAD